MPENFNFLFKYLKKEKITIDKTEFLFQVNSHPDYPSLFAISETLNFLKIDNMALRFDFAKHGLLPSRFIALLEIQDSRPALCYVEKKGDDFFYVKDKTAIDITKTDLEQLWGGIVLLVEKPEVEIPNTKNYFFWLLPTSCLLLLFTSLFFMEANPVEKVFIVFPILGTLLSIASLKELLGVKNELVSSFCNMFVSGDCGAVIASDKLKLFKFLDFSSLSLIFFTTQFLGHLLFLFVGNTSDFFGIQSILLVCTLPIIGISIYYQKYIEKKWCPICLAIISILLMESGYIYFFLDSNYAVGFESLSYFLLLLSSIALVWSLLKNTLSKQKELREFQLKSNRFIRNYGTFKNLLLASNRIVPPKSPFLLGNIHSDFEITVITNPLCGFCKKADSVLNEIINAKGNQLKVKMLFNVDLNAQSEELKLFYRSLLMVYIENGQKAFGNALKHWFENSNLKLWLKKYSREVKSIETDGFFNGQNKWCLSNGLNFTPAIFINGYMYPEVYEIENLGFFINELLEDNIS